MLIFFPIRAQIKLHKWPVLTVLISLACLAIYYAQTRNEDRVVQSAESYCTEQASSSEREAWVSWGMERRLTSALTRSRTCIRHRVRNRSSRTWKRGLPAS